MPRPLADNVRAAILTDIRAGTLSRNAIARAHGVSAGTVSNIARDANLTAAFDRSQTVQATRAREADTASARADLAARRTALAEALQDDAERLRVQLWQPCVYGEFGGKENVWSQVNLDQPRFGDQRQILGSVQTAVNTSAKLVPADGADDATAVRSMLGDLGAALTDAFGGEGDSSDRG